MTAWYSGFWDFQEHEYALYRIRYPDDPLTESEFTKTLASIAQRWTEVDVLLQATTGLIELFSSVALEETWWYDPVWTVCDLRALAESLRLSSTRYAKRARIQCT